MKRIVASLVVAGMLVHAAPNVFPIKVVSAAQTTKSLVTGSSYDAKWMDGQHLLFTNEKEEKPSTYLVNIQTKQVMKQFDQSEMVISPNKKLAVFTDENDGLYLLELQSSKITTLSNDSSFKSEFVWSKDGSKIYFLQGDKSETISFVAVSDGSITKILDDKVEYKSDLRLSADETKFFYLAAKQAETKYTDDKKTDVETIVTDGTDPQLFVFDPTGSKPEPAAITTSKENKFFITPLQDGRVLYLEVNTENEEKLPQLKISSQDGKNLSDLVTSKQIEGVTVSGNDGIYILVKESDSSSSIYKVLPTGTLQKKVNTKQDITSLVVSQDGRFIAATISTDKGDKLAIFKNGQLEDLTTN